MLTPDPFASRVASAAGRLRSSDAKSGISLGDVHFLVKKIPQRTPPEELPRQLKREPQRPASEK